MAPLRNRLSTRASVKALILFLFLSTGVFLYYFTPLKDFLSQGALGRYLERIGPWSPFLFILIYAVCICLFVPASIMTLLGALVFGTSLGFVYGWIAAVVGSSGAFQIGRVFGRGFVEGLVGERLEKYDNIIEQNGFATVLYLRLLNFPFTPLNYAMSLTKVRFSDFILGTALGIPVSFLVLTVLGGALKEFWTSGGWERLFSARVIFALALFLFSFFIPRLIKRFKGESPVKRPANISSP